MSTVIKNINSFKIYYHYDHSNSEIFCNIAIHNISDNKLCESFSLKHYIGDLAIKYYASTGCYKLDKKICCIENIDWQVRFAIIAYSFSNKYVKFTYNCHARISYIEYDDNYKFSYNRIHRDHYGPGSEGVATIISKTKMFSAHLITSHIHQIHPRVFERKGENIEKSIAKIRSQLHKKYEETLLQLSKHLPILIFGILKTIRDYIICPAEHVSPEFCKEITLQI